MTEPSNFSSAPSPTGGVASISLTEAVEAIRRRQAEQPPRTAPSGLSVSIESLRRKFASAAQADQARQDRVEERQRQYRQQATNHDLLTRSNLPERHRTMLREIDHDGPWGEQWRSVSEVIGRDGGCLLALVGNRGTGKTQMGACAIDQSCWSGRSALYVEAGPMFMQIRDSFKDGGEGEHKTYSRFIAPKLLVIDQMEERKHSEHEDRMLFSILNRRYADELDTILVSNETASAFLAGLGPSIASRMAQTGEVIVCDWADKRKASNAN